MIEALLDIGLLIVVAKVAEGVLGRYGLSSIIAYTLTGILFGPVTGIINLTDQHLVDELDLFLNIGVFLFFFLVGLNEIDLPSFKATIRGRFFAAAVISVFISMVAAMLATSDLFPVGFALGLDFTAALALSGILSLSSLGLVTKVLADSGQLKKPIGLEIFTVVIIAELIALLLIGFAIGETQHEPSLAGVLLLLGHIAVFTVVAWVLSAKVLPRVLLFLEARYNVPELAFGLINGGLFLTVVAAERMELHGSIGALLFGVALSGIPRRVHREIMPGMRSAAEGLFVPLFFAAAGLRLDLSFVNLPPVTIAALAIIPFLGKFAGAFIGAYAARLDKPYANATGLMAKGVSEIALLLVLLEAGVIGQDVFSLLVLVMFGYLLFMPAAINFAVNKAAETHRPTLPAAVPPSFARHALDDMVVRHILDRTRTFPGPAVSLKEFTERWTEPNQLDYVVADGGKVAGIASMARVRLAPREAWADTPLSQVLRTDPPRVTPDEHVEDALKLMAHDAVSVIPVVDAGSGALLGAVTKDDVMELVTLVDEIAAELGEKRETGEQVLERLGAVDEAAEELKHGHRGGGQDEAQDR